METAIKQYLIDNGFVELRDYEEFYQINAVGEIWSCSYNKIMKPSEQEGYLTLGLTKNGIKHKAKIHRLLALQFIENSENYPEVDHIDRDRSNNKIENLRWADRTMQANNKTTNLVLLTAEEMAQRAIDLTEYKRVWAEKNRRAKGVPIKEKIKTANELEYKREWAANHRSNMTLTEKEAQNAHRRETRKENTPEQKAAAIVRAKIQAEQIKADPEKAAADRERRKLKMREKRANQTPAERAEENEKSRLRMADKYDLAKK